MTATAAPLMLAVVGHVDHGKTTLVRALTGMETDRLPEEKRRGLSIVVGYAHLRLGERVVDILDAPGHERFVRAMAAATGAADALILVVDAVEGPRAQTREHLAIARLLGVRRAIVAITRTDLVDAARIEAAGAAAAALARAEGVEPLVLLPVCAPTGAGIDALREAIARLAAAAPPPGDEGFAVLPIDRAFHVAGHGLVVTGALRRGPLSVGQSLELLPSGARVTVRGLQTHGGPAARVGPGVRTAVNLRGVDLNAVAPGQVLASGDVLAPSAWLTARIELLDQARPLADGARLEGLIGAARHPVRLRLLDRPALEPGETALVQLHAQSPVCALAGERFVLRHGSPPATIGGGVIVDPAARRQRRSDTAALGSWDGLAAAPLKDRPAHLLARAGVRGVSVARLAQLSATPAARLAELDGAVRLRGQTLFAASALAQVRARVLDALARAQGPLPRPALVQALAPAAPAAVEAALDALTAAGKLHLDAGRVALAQPEGEGAKTARIAAVAARMAADLARGRLTPEPPASTTPHERKALAELIRSGVAVRTFDKVQRREVVFHRDAVAEAVRVLRLALAGSPGATVGEIGRLLGITRRFSVPLLEHLDARGVTRRCGDVRRLAEADGNRTHHPLLAGRRF